MLFLSEERKHVIVKVWRVTGKGVLGREEGRAPEEGRYTSSSLNRDDSIGNERERLLEGWRRWVFHEMTRRNACFFDIWKRIVSDDLRRILTHPRFVFVELSQDSNESISEWTEHDRGIEKIGRRGTLLCSRRERERGVLREYGRDKEEEGIVFWMEKKRKRAKRIMPSDGKWYTSRVQSDRKNVPLSGRFKP